MQGQILSVIGVLRGVRGQNQARSFHKNYLLKGLVRQIIGLERGLERGSQQWSPSDAGTCRSPSSEGVRRPPGGGADLCAREQPAPDGHLAVRQFSGGYGNSVGGRDMARTGERKCLFGARGNGGKSLLLIGDRHVSP